MSEFQGFPEAALDFYDDLEMDNTRSYWEAHKATYLESVKAPMVALTDALAPEFGTAKIFRPFRDVRFAKDKTPYKINQGAFISAGPACGWYVDISARGVRTGGGAYDVSSTNLARIRASIDSEATGKQLEKILEKLRKAGFEIGGTRLKTTPRGYDADHPRIDLLRHKSLTIGRSYGFEPVIHTPELVD
ncbi:MAG: hypothetical protein JWP74_4020, partial [Marmoricola sp.]|nr:hypothetical protein [Marmoricola sp.]